MKLHEFLEATKLMPSVVTTRMNIKGKRVDYSDTTLYVLDNSTFRMFRQLFGDDMCHRSPYTTLHHTQPTHAFPIGNSTYEENNSFRKYCENSETYGLKYIHTYNVKGDMSCIIVLSEKDFVLREGGSVQLNFVKLFPIIEVVEKKSY